MLQPDKRFKDLAFSRRLRLVLLGLGVLFRMFFIITVKPVFLPATVQLGCLTALVCCTAAGSATAGFPAAVSATGFLAASVAAYASLG